MKIEVKIFPDEKYFRSYVNVWPEDIREEATLQLAGWYSDYDEEEVVYYYYPDHLHNTLEGALRAVETALEQIERYSQKARELLAFCEKVSSEYNISLEEVVELRRKYADATLQKEAEAIAEALKEEVRHE